MNPTKEASNQDEQSPAPVGSHSFVGHRIVTSKEANLECRSRKSSTTATLPHAAASEESDGSFCAIECKETEHEDLETENRTLIVNFDSYGASHLEFFIYTFTKTTQWVQYHEVKQDVLMKIMNIVHEHGAEFAFPTRTLHLVSQNDDGPATGLEDNNPEDAQHVQR